MTKYWLLEENLANVDFTLLGKSTHLAVVGGKDCGV